MRNIAKLVERYEMMAMAGVNTTDVAMTIYAELIQDGCICDEMRDKDFVMDLLLIGLEYEFADENTLEMLADEITIIALVDSMPETIIKDLVKAILDMEDLETPEFDDNMIPFSDLPEDEEEISELYIVTSVHVDVDSMEKETEIVDKIFTSIEDIRDYVDKIGLTMAADNVLTAKDQDTGCTGMLATEDAMDVLDELGMDGMLIADQIPEGAVGVMTLITTNKKRDIIKAGDIFAVFEATEYIN